MQVSISATNVGHIMNADVMNIDRLSALSEEEQRTLERQLIARLDSLARALTSQSNTIEPLKAQALANETKALTKALSDDGVRPEDKKARVARYFGTLRDVLGDVADVLLSAVKIAQVFGLG